MAKITVLGSTGSIGTQALDVLRTFGEEGCAAVLCARKNAALVLEQAREFRPAAVCIGDESLRSEVQDALGETGARVLSGREGMDELVVRDEADRIVVSVAGTPGLSGRPRVSTPEPALTSSASAWPW